MRIFGRVEPYIECISSFLYSIIFQLYQTFEPPNSTPGEINICARGLLYEIQFQTTFILSIFPCNVYFWLHSSLFENFRMGHIW